MCSFCQSIKQKPAQATFDNMSKMPKKDCETRKCRCFVERLVVDSDLGSMRPTLASSKNSVESRSSLECHTILFEHAPKRSGRLLVGLRGCVLVMLVAHRYALHYLYSWLRSDAIDVVLRFSEPRNFNICCPRELSKCKSAFVSANARLRNTVLCGVMEAQVG